MKLLLDMNLSPDWLPLLRAHGFDAVHWSDKEIMDWAYERGHVVFTHDLDFGILLAPTKARGPSVMRVRAQDVRPGNPGLLVLNALRAHGDALGTGALLTVSEAKSRVRILPI